MAFGSWLKNLGKKIVNGFKKVVPIVKKVGKVVKNTISPILGTIGTAVGGKAGKALNSASNITGTVADRTLSITDKVDNYLKNKSALDDFITHERNLGRSLADLRSRVGPK